MCASVFFGRRLGLQLLHRKPTVAKVAPVAHFSLRFFSLSKLNAKMVLAGKEDNFGGVTIIADEAWKDANDTPGFKKALEESLEEWKKAGKRGLWIKFPTSHGNLVGAATSNGFDFHHAQPGYTMVARWLPETKSMLPGYATHYMGVGSMVINDKNQILVIKEKYRTGDGHFWKLPGGLCDAGEDIAKCAVREVREETGVDAEFVSFVGFREKHGYTWGRDDFYYYAYLRPKSHEINIDTEEIEKAQWLDFEEFIRHPSVNPTNKHMAAALYCGLKNGGSDPGRAPFDTPMEVLAFSLKWYNTVFTTCNEQAKQFLLSLKEVQEFEHRYYKDVDNKGNPSPLP